MSTDTLYEQLRGHLHYLKLAAIADALAPALEHAERQQPGYTQFLHGLLNGVPPFRWTGVDHAITQPGWLVSL